jgi:putative endonuclease
VDYGNGLENRRRASDRGFESHPLRLHRAKSTGLPLMLEKTSLTQDWFFYILKCRDDSLYCGITTDLNVRLTKHNNGKGAAYTRSHRPVILVHFEKFNSLSEARKREAQVKSWSREKKILLIAGFPRYSSE